MSRKQFHRMPKEIVVTVKENPLDVEAAKYIKLFSAVIAADKKQKENRKSASQSKT